MNSTFVFVFGVALFASACAQEQKKLVALPAHDFENGTDFDNLLKGRPVIGTVELGEPRLLRFGILPSDEGEFPNAVVTLTTTNAHGDADLFCAPWVYLRRANRLPGRRFHVWRSIHSQDQDSIFLSSKSAEYQDALVELDTSSDGKNSTALAAAFACSVAGESNTPSEFEFELDVSFNEHKLVKEEQKAMKSIYKKCCTGESCLRWLRHTGNITERVEIDDTEIELDFCHRYGSVCTSQGRLKRLDMRGYNLTCPFPVEELAKMESLEKLDLDRNQLEGDVGEILAGLAGLKKLVHISLGDNDISGTLSSPSEACDLFEGGLQFINLRANRINGRVPSCMLASPKLREFHMSRNSLFGKIPDVIPEGSDLEAISLTTNRLSGSIPKSFANAELLRYVFLSKNRFSGQIPDALGALPFMETLDLSNNKFAALPDAWTDPEWTPPETLRRVSVASNSIKDEFPGPLGKAENLGTLDISENSIHGELVIEEGSFPSTINFNASFNEIEGTIPEAAAGMGVFQPIPLTLGEFPRFDVRSNKMSGEIPAFFYPNVTGSIAFRGIHLEDNEFTCRSPDDLQYIFELECNPDPAGYEDQVVVELTGQPDIEKRSESSSSKKSSTGKILPAVLGCLAGVVIVAAIVAVIVIRRKKNKRMAHVIYPKDGDVEIGGVAAAPDTEPNAENGQDNDRILPADSVRS
ncbi:hypothetical protein BSKO_00880 [Bryopsis sp. KO-2023]|nr:hypothetical protein BSKO_00880 [Bryopsis sp. KO-2023]